MFWDLFVTWPNNKAQQKRMIEMAITLGYDGIVFTQVIQDKYNVKTTKNPMTVIPLSELNVTFPAQSSALRLSSTTSPFALTSPRSFTAFQQKFRLHAVLSEPSHLTALATHNNPSHPLLTYHIISVTPITDTLLHAACGSSDIDLISLPCSQRLGFYLKLPSLHLAAQNGIMFELLYGKGVRESASRRHLFATAAAVRRVRGGVKEGVVMASGAERAEELRGCYDVMSVMRLMGWQEQEARAAMSSACERVLWHGQTRRTTKAALLVRRVEGKRGRDEDGQEAGHKEEKESEPLGRTVTEAEEPAVESEGKTEDEVGDVETTGEQAGDNPSGKRRRTGT